VSSASGIAIDDFGTGYSSLAYLSRLPIARLKIDAGFVHRMTNDPRDAKLAQSIVSLGHGLGHQGDRGKASRTPRSSRCCVAWSATRCRDSTSAGRRASCPPEFLPAVTRPPWQRPFAMGYPFASHVANPPSISTTG
jgi:hypothetical protein